MQPIEAYVNYGRWKWRCPYCGVANWALDNKGVCAACFPGMIAMAFVEKPGHENRKKKLFIPVADLEEREATRKEAQELGREYVIKLPPKKQKDQVDALLRPRPVHKMNWHPERGETVEDLIAENKKDGV